MRAVFEEYWEELGALQFDSRGDAWPTWQAAWHASRAAQPGLSEGQVREQLKCLCTGSVEDAYCPKHGAHNDAMAQEVSAKHALAAVGELEQHGVVFDKEYFIGYIESCIELAIEEAFYKLSLKQATMLAPVYYVRHPDETYSTAVPQPQLAASQASPSVITGPSNEAKEK